MILENYAFKRRQKGKKLLPLFAHQAFLQGTGFLGTMIESFDWSNTPLGPLEQWPQSLKTSVSIILNSQHPMWIGWGPEMTFIYNDAYIQVLSLAKHPWALGRPASEVWAEIWDVCGPIAEKVFEEGEATFIDHVRLFMKREDFLEETFYSFSYSPIRDESGKVGGLFCPSTEITDKMLNERRLRVLQELSTHSLVAKSVSIACNLALETLAKDLDDLPFALLYLANLEEGKIKLQAVAHLKKGSEMAPLEIDFKSKSKTELIRSILEVYYHGKPIILPLCSPLHSSNLPLGLAQQPVKEAIILPLQVQGRKNPVGILIAGINPCRKLTTDHRTFFDLVSAQITLAIQNAQTHQEERKRAQALAEIDRAKTIFFSNVSHEFRTPLTLMLGPLEDSLRDQENPLSAPQRERQEFTYRNALRLLKLVNSLLDFSKIEIGKMKARFQPTHLGQLTIQIADIFRSTIENAGLKFIVKMDPIFEPVFVDREMWEKIVLNLLSNAFKYTLQGEIEISLNQKKSGISLSVRDTGIGIPKGEIPRIFEHFHRVEGAKGRSHEGSGIGLALISELAKLHGGSIRVKSKLNQGSTFIVELPLGKSHLPEDQIQETNVPPISGSLGASFAEEASRWILDEKKEPLKLTTTNLGQGNRPKILLADDNADMRKYVQGILCENWEVFTVSDGQAALEFIKKDLPDLILSDIMMPKMDGFQLLEKIRSDPELRFIPVIFLSARAGEEAKVEGLHAGADDYLIKPFSAKELIARVRTHLEIARFRKEAIQQQDRIYSVLMQAPVAICLLDGPNHILSLSNEYFYELTSRDSDIRGKPVRECFPEIKDQKFFELLDQVFQTGEFCSRTEAPLNFLQKDGKVKTRFINFVYSPRKDSQGNIHGIIGVHIDVTKQVLAHQKMEKLTLELKSAIAIRDEFMSIASHELKTPITALQLHLELTQKRLIALTENSQNKEIMEKINKAILLSSRQIDRLTNLVENLLDSTRIQSGRLTFNFQELELNGLIQEIVERFRRPLEAAKCPLEIRIQPNLIVNWDQLRIEQVLVNLISNSIKYAAGKPISIHAVTDGKLVTLVFHDQGPGIPKKNQSKIFERFERVQSAKHVSGLGLGLFIVKQIIIGHGGNVSLESEEGEGTKFIFTLPLQPDSQSKPPMN